MSSTLLQTRNKDMNGLTINLSPIQLGESSPGQNFLQFPQTCQTSPSYLTSKKSSLNPLSPLPSIRCSDKFIANSINDNNSVNSLPSDTDFSVTDRLCGEQKPDNRSSSIDCDTNDNLTNCTKVIKSGNLMLILPQQCPYSRNPSPKSSNKNSDKQQDHNMSAKKYPVSVKVHKKAFERYAIISRGQRVHQTSPPVFINLRNASVTQCDHNPKQFVVVTSGVEGRYLQFEASSLEKAQDWSEAFSSPAQPPRSPHRFCGVQFEAPKSPKHISTDISKENTSSDQAKGSSLSPPTLSPRTPRIPLMPVLTESFEETDEE